MSEYENKSIEELIELIECKDEEINDLQQENQHAEELAEEIIDYENEREEYNSALADRENVSEVAFIAGHEAGTKKEPQMKSWLNFKIGARI